MYSVIYTPNKVRYTILHSEVEKNVTKDRKMNKKTDGWFRQQRSRSHNRKHN